MEARRFVPFVVLGFASAVPLTAGHPGKGPSSEVRFQLSAEGEVVVPVVIQGKGPFRLLLDTGANHTGISQALANDLGAAAIAQAPVKTSIGTVMTAVVKLGEVSIGEAHASSLVAAIIPAAVVRSLGDGVSGILGQDFLSQFDYTLDYRTLRLRWSPGIDAPDQVRLTLERASGRYLVHLPQDARCQCALRLVPDSGANGVVLFAGTAADRLAVGARPTSINVSTIAGSGVAQGVIVNELRVGAARLSRQPAARIERPGADADDGDGLLPLSLFAQVSFNNREGYMTVQQR